MFKYAVMGFLICLVLSAILYLSFVDSGHILLFIAQSIVDNAIFCIMFIIIVIVTGINC